MLVDAAERPRVQILRARRVRPKRGEALRVQAQHHVDPREPLDCVLTRVLTPFLLRSLALSVVLSSRGLVETARVEPPLDRGTTI